MPKYEKGDKSAKSLQTFPNVNQVISTLDSICDPNIMILAQAVLEILCSQGSIGLQWKSRKNIEKGL